MHVYTYIPYLSIYLSIYTNPYLHLCVPRDNLRLYERLPTWPPGRPHWGLCLRRTGASGSTAFPRFKESNHVIYFLRTSRRSRRSPVPAHKVPRFGCAQPRSGSCCILQRQGSPSTVQLSRQREAIHRACKAELGVRRPRIRASAGYLGPWRMQNSSERRGTKARQPCN